MNQERTLLPGLNQHQAENKVSSSKTKHSSEAEQETPLSQVQHPTTETMRSSRMNIYIHVHVGAAKYIPRPNPILTINNRSLFLFTTSMHCMF